MNGGEEDIGERFRNTQERYEEEQKKTGAACGDKEPSTGNGKDPDQETSAETVRLLRFDIGQLHFESPQETVMAILCRISRSIPDEFTRELLLRSIKTQTKASILWLRKQLPPPPPPPSDTPDQPNPQFVEKVEDFYAYLPDHKFIYVPTRALWVADSINERFGAVDTGRRDH